MTAIRKREWTTPTGEAKAAWLVDYRDAGGVRRAKQFSRKKDAEAWLTQAAYHVSQGTHTADSQSISIERAGELWLAAGRRENLEVSTLASYEQHIRLHINPLCGAQKLSRMTTPLAEGYRDKLVEKLSRPMAIRVLRSLTAIVAEAKRAGYVAQNVFQSVKVKRAKRERRKVVIPPKAHLQQLIVAAQASADPMALPLVTVVVFAGLRASELRGLPWSSIDLKGATITVEQRADMTNSIGSPKSEAGQRTIPLPGMAVQALRAWKLRCPKNVANLVFPSVAGAVMSHRYMTLNVLAPVQISAGLCDTIEREDAEPLHVTHYTLHDFRHAAASLWIERRTDPKRVQTWMGHHSIQVTFDVYGHLFAQVEQDSSIADAVERELMSAAHATPMQHEARNARKTVGPNGL